MFVNIFEAKELFNHVELVCENDEWKINVATTPDSERVVNNFLAKHKTYHTELNSFVSELPNDRYDNPFAFESEVFARLRAANK
jgi:hypothetical protein